MAHDFKDATRLLPEFGMTDTGQGWRVEMIGGCGGFTRREAEQLCSLLNWLCSLLNWLGERDIVAQPDGTFALLERIDD